MKAEITIHGGIHGNFVIARALRDYTEKRDGMFNRFHLYYDTVAEAKADLRKAYKSIKSELTPDRYSVVWINRDNSQLNYDASIATVKKANE